MGNFSRIGNGTLKWIVCQVITGLLTLTYATGSGEICYLGDDLNTCYKKFLSFEAIGHIHKLLDNDKNGEVDPSETDKFLRQEFSLSERASKSRSLAEDDPLISLHDLWSLWKNNPAFNWTLKQTADWLDNCVELSQYQEVFARNNIDGKALPLLALQNMSYITDVLLIRNPIHKRKLMLKALDTILFGPPHRPGMLSFRDPVFTAATFGLIAALLVFSASIRAYCTSSLAKSGVGSSADLAAGLGLSANEEALRQLQRRLDDLEYLRSTLSNVDCMFNPAGRPLDPRTICHPNSARQPARPSQPVNTGKFTKALPGHREHLEEVVEDDNDVPTTNVTSPAFTVDSNMSSSGSGTDSTDQNRGEVATGTPTNLSLEPALPPCPSELVARETTEPVGMSRSSSFCSLSYGQADRVSGGLQQHQLVLLLQVTHELEMKHFRARRLAVEKELALVRAECKRLHRKRYNILGSVRLVHSDDFDDLEQRMLNAKLSMEHLQQEIREFTARWIRIETLTGHCLRENPGLEQLYKALGQQLTTTTSAVPTAGLQQQQLNKLGAHWLCTDSDASARSESTLLLPVDLNEQPPVAASLTTKYSLSQQRHHSLATSSKSGLPRNYSFVRPFATLWRKKAGSRAVVATPVNKKNQ